MMYIKENMTYGKYCDVKRGGCFGFLFCKDFSRNYYLVYIVEIYEIIIISSFISSDITASLFSSLRTCGNLHRTINRSLPNISVCRKRQGGALAPSGISNLY